MQLCYSLLLGRHCFPEAPGSELGGGGSLQGAAPRTAITDRYMRELRSHNGAPINFLPLHEK